MIQRTITTTHTKLQPRTWLVSALGNHHLSLYWACPFLLRPCYEEWSRHHLPGVLIPSRCCRHALISQNEIRIVSVDFYVISLMYAMPRTESVASSSTIALPRSAESIRGEGRRTVSKVVIINSSFQRCTLSLSGCVNQIGPKLIIAWLQIAYNSRRPIVATLRMDYRHPRSLNPRGVLLIEYIQTHYIILIASQANDDHQRCPHRLQEP